MKSIHRLELDVVDNPDALRRIVSTCHQRGCRIVSLHYDLGVDAECVSLSVEAEPPSARRLTLKLATLVHVVAVRASGLPAGSDPAEQVQAPVCR